MAKHPTSRGRNQRKKLKLKYSKAREEAQLHGIIETQPEGAIRDERVAPASQSEQQLPALDRAAIRNGWEVPEHERHNVIDRLIEPFHDPEASLLLLARNAQVLILADQRQYERDHPSESKVKVEHSLEGGLLRELLAKVEESPVIEGKVDGTADAAAES